MQVAELWVYPIKSLRGVAVTSAELTQKGFAYDRRFMLLKVHRTGSAVTYENLHIASYPQMCLFTTSITFPSQNSATSGSVRVTYTNPEDKSTKEISISLQPDVSRRETITIDMHKSEGQGHLMDAEHSNWFSSCFGFEVVLAHVGSNGRPVLGNFAPNAAIRNAQLKLQKEQSHSSSWIPSIANRIVNTLGVGPISPRVDEGYEIGFADCAPLLIVSTKSLENVADRLLPDGKLDLTKFRPNIVLSGASKAFDEDFWAELTLATSGAKLNLTTNCVRCASINVDYETGNYGKGAAGSLLKKLQSDRRIDKGVKYSPVFGRYTFLDRGSDSAAGDGLVINVGDEVEVTKRNTEYTVSKWPGLGSQASDDLYPV